MSFSSIQSHNRIELKIYYQLPESKISDLKSITQTNLETSFKVINTKVI